MLIWTFWRHGRFPLTFRGKPTTVNDPIPLSAGERRKGRIKLCYPTLAVGGGGGGAGGGESLDPSSWQVIPMQSMLGVSFPPDPSRQKEGSGWYLFPDHSQYIPWRE